MNRVIVMPLRCCFLAVSALICSGADKGLTDFMADKADAVVVGEVQSGQQSGRSAIFVLVVDRCLKGDVPSGTAINVRWDEAWPSRNVSLPAGYGMWFLQKAVNGTWTLVPVKQGQGKVPFELSYFALSKANTPTTAGNSKSMGLSDIIATELVTAMQHYKDLNQLKALADGLLDIGDSTVTIDLCRNLSVSSDPELRFIGLTGLVRAHDASSLAELAKSMDAIPTLKLREFPLGAIRSQRDASPDTIQALGRFASSSSALVQKNAAEALGYIHTPATLPLLAALLNSPDPSAREAAIRGLSLFVDNLPITTLDSTPSQKWRVPQGPAPYRTHDTGLYSLSTRALDPAQEAKYLQFWKSWWATMKDQLTK